MNGFYSTRRTFAATLAAPLLFATLARAQNPTPIDISPPITITAPPAVPQGKTFAITLPTALKLANANPLDIAVANERLQVALAQQQRANVLWVPTIDIGADYFRHDGRLQDIVGNVFSTSRSSVMVGAGPVAIVALGDAVYAPLAARQVVCARRADIESACNDVALQVGEAYATVQQARGDVAGALEAARRAEDLTQRVEKLAPGLVPGLEVNRAKAELARRKQAIEVAYERWQVASAELSRLLRLDATMIVEPVEPPDLRIDLVDASQRVDDLIPQALSNRPELASHQAIVQATLTKLRQEKIRPLVPSVLLRGAATNPAGNLAGGYFGGGVNDNLSNFGARNSIDLQLVWELQNLGLGNRAAVKEKQADNRLAVLELFRVQDRIAAEVATAYAQATRANERVRLAEDELSNAITAADLNLKGLSQTKRIGDSIILVVRPQEAVAAVTALEQAFRSYYAAIGDANRGQLRLHRALGHSASASPLATDAK